MIRGAGRELVGAARAAAARAFTLVELLVVIAIIAIATTLLVPAFGRVLESVNYSAAVNTVVGTLGNARALAIRSGRSTAVAFLYDPARGVYSLQVLEQGRYGGSLSGEQGFGGVEEFAATFRPAANSTPVELPAGTGVFGLPLLDQVRPLDNSGSWVDFLDGDTSAWYAGMFQGNPGSPTDPLKPLWLFPHNDGRVYMENGDPGGDRFYGGDPWRALFGIGGAGASASRARDAARHAMSFMIQFNSDGSIATRTDEGAGVRSGYIELPEAPRDRLDADADPYDEPDVFDPEEVAVSNPSSRAEPNPEVWLQSAVQLAVVDLSRMSEELGVRDAWRARPTYSRMPRPTWQDDAGYFQDDDADALHRAVSDWIDENGEVLGFARYTGAVMRKESR